MPPKNPSVKMSDMARLRQGAYWLFSQSLLYPDVRRLELLKQVARELAQGLYRWESLAFFPEWRNCLCHLGNLRYKEHRAIQEEYVSNFVANYEGIPCPLYESAYLGKEPHSTGWLLSQLEKEYREMGLSLSPALKEPPDHAAVELAFMAFLCSQEAEHWSSRRAVEAVQLMRQERAFLASHLTWWFPELARRVAPPGGKRHFAIITATASSFLVHENGLLDALLERFQAVTVRRP